MVWSHVGGKKPTLPPHPTSSSQWGGSSLQVQPGSGQTVPIESPALPSSQIGQCPRMATPGEGRTAEASGSELLHSGAKWKQPLV